MLWLAKLRWLQMVKWSIEPGMDLDDVWMVVLGKKNASLPEIRGYWILVLIHIEEKSMWT